MRLHAQPPRSRTALSTCLRRHPGSASICTSSRSSPRAASTTRSTRRRSFSTGSNRPRARTASTPITGCGTRNCSAGSRVLRRSEPGAGPVPGGAAGSGRRRMRAAAKGTRRSRSEAPAGSRQRTCRRARQSRRRRRWSGCGTQLAAGSFTSKPAIRGDYLTAWFGNAIRGVGTEGHRLEPGAMYARFGFAAGKGHRPEKISTDPWVFL
jgi:hypothetical protein